MLRRVYSLLQNSFNISPDSRVAIFPLHLDPPTAQHRELFKLLLGIQAKNETKSSAEKQVYSNNIFSPSSLSSSSLSSLQKLESSKDAKLKWQETNKETSKTQEEKHGICQNYILELLTKYKLSKKYWYMAPFADSLYEDSQLVPFDDLVLIPNTRYPVSLKRSTHLAALSILATRNLPHVHVDFTALEHPDESMPVIYELVNEFPHSVLVHWLHDAYEMQHWRYFSEIKRRVPLLLLQTISYEPILLTHEPPVLGSSINADNTASSNNNNNNNKISTITSNAKEREADGTLAEEKILHALSSRQYISPERKDAIKSSNERHYYEEVAEHLRARHARQQNLNKLQLTKLQQGNINNHGNCRRHYSKNGSCESDEYNDDDYDDVDVVNKDNIEVVNIVHGPHGKRLLEREMQKHLEYNNNHLNIKNNSNSEYKVKNNIDADECREQEATSKKELFIESQHANKECENGLLQHHKYKEEEQQRQDEEDEYVKGEWWHTKGGRGDDAVEISRSYITSEGSSWLGIASASSSHSPSAALSSAANSKGQNGYARGNGKDRSNFWQTSFGAAKNKQRTNSAKSKSCLTRTVCQLLDELYPLPFSLLHGYKKHASDGTGSEVQQISKPVIQEGLENYDVNLRSRDEHNNYNNNDDIKEKPEITEIQSCNVTNVANAGNSANDKKSSPNQFNMRYTSPTQSEQFSPTSASEVPSSIFFPSSRVWQKELPMVEVHPITRCTGADVRQALWEEEIEPSLILTDSVARYVESHALYRDSRKFFSSSVNGSAILSNNNTNGYAANSSNKANNNAHTNSLTQWHSNFMPTSSTSYSSSMANKGVHTANPHDMYKKDVNNVNGYLGGRYINSQLGMPDTIVESPFSNASHAKMFAKSMHEGDDVNGGRNNNNNNDTNNKSNWSHQSSHTVMHPSAKSFSSSASSTSSSLFNSSSRRSVQRDSITIMNFSGLIPRLELHYDKTNLLAREQFEVLKVFQVHDNEEPDLIVPIGGDGYMMHCIRRNWRRFIPFYGVNAGHVGYLLNERSTLEELFTMPLKLYMTTMLYCQAERETEHGERVMLSELAFNDAWVERASGQTALIRILVNGEERIRKLRGDGVLVSTAAGSTAYSKALGASPLPVGAPLIQVVGSNVVSPAQWRPVHLDQEDEVEFEVIDTNKRPCRCFVDSVDVGNVSRMLIRSSRVASVSLAFSQSFDLQQKLYKMQFPQALERDFSPY